MKKKLSMTFDRQIMQVQIKFFFFFKKHLKIIYIEYNFFLLP